MIILNATVPLLALAGTGIQAFQSLRQVKEVDPQGHRAFVTIDDLKIEYRFTRHPVLWYRRKREMDALLRESPEEARLYRRVWLQMWGWLLLAGASVLAVVAAFVA